jgi:hypothetical protein
LRSILNSWVGLVIIIVALMLTFLRTFLATYKVLVRTFW